MVLLRVLRISHISYQLHVFRNSTFLQPTDLSMLELPILSGYNSIDLLFGPYVLAYWYDVPGELRTREREQRLRIAKYLETTGKTTETGEWSPHSKLRSTTIGEVRLG